MDLVFQNFTPDKSFDSKFFEKISIKTIQESKLINKKIEISVNLVDEAKIKELNKKYRNKNKVTDVLSFPMAEKLENEFENPLGEKAEDILDREE